MGAGHVSEVGEDAPVGSSDDHGFEPPLVTIKIGGHAGMHAVAGRRCPAVEKAIGRAGIFSQVDVSAVGRATTTASWGNRPQALMGFGT